MAVYERRYRTWQGVPTPEWSRFLVIPKYAIREVFRRRLFTSFYLAAGLAWPLGCIVIVYLLYNIEMAASLGLAIRDLPPVNREFFYIFLRVQGVIAFMVAFIAGPSLISMDTTQNGLPLYFSRPLSRTQYVLGKFAVLGILLSLITWVAGWIVFLFQASLRGFPYFRENLWIPVALFAGAWFWIIALNLLVLAVSAYVKRAQTARGVLLLVFVVFAGFGEALSQIPGLGAARLINPAYDIAVMWERLFSLPSKLSPGAAASALLGMAGLSLFLLNRKVRPLDIVK
jgi:ABC-2 type transport system permease protein